jgi:hypothetical protein
MASSRNNQGPSSPTALGRQHYMLRERQRKEPVPRMRPGCNHRTARGDIYGGVPSAPLPSPHPSGQAGQGPAAATKPRGIQKPHAHAPSMGHPKNRGASARQRPNGTGPPPSAKLGINSGGRYESEENSETPRSYTERGAPEKSGASARRAGRKRAGDRAQCASRRGRRGLLEWR